MGISPRNIRCQRMRAGYQHNEEAKILEQMLQNIESIAPAKWVISWEATVLIERFTCRAAMASG